MSMNSLIEQAARRLDQLRQAGAELPTDSTTPVAQVAASAPEGGAAKALTVSRHVDLDLPMLGRAGIAIPHAPRSRVADQFRVIKRPLIGNATGKGAMAIANGNLVMITSALPGEGKTFTAINLAMSLANELDCTVMLVDADVTRPSVMSTLGLPPGPGLLDLVQDPSLDMASTLLRTNVDKLTLLPSGTPHPRATELLASEAMARLVGEMAKRYADRIIVFDSPPLLLATESRVLATHMGQIVMVVHAEKTLQADVMEALSTIESCPVKLMLLNQARESTVAGSGYGYGYAGEGGYAHAYG